MAHPGPPVATGDIESMTGQLVREVMLLIPESKRPEHNPNVHGYHQHLELDGPNRHIEANSKTGNAGMASEHPLHGHDRAGRVL
jgi:hypothetical protein